MAVEIIFNKVFDFVKDIETNSRNMAPKLRGKNAQNLRSYFFFKLGRKKQITPTKGKKEQQ